MQGSPCTPPPSHQPRLRPLENYTSTQNDIRAIRRTSSSALSNTSTTDYEDTFSDLDSSHEAITLPLQIHQSSRATSPGDTKKSKTSGLRLSLKSLRAPKISSQINPDEQSPDIPSRQPSIENTKTPFGRPISLEVQPCEGRTSFDSVDPRRLASPSPHLSTSIPKTSNRFSFIHSPTPPTPTMSRSSHSRSQTTPTGSPNPSNHGTSPHNMASPSPRPVKETHTMMKDYDPMTGNKMINKYMVVQELGRGVHGKVKLCRDTETDELCAIKIVDKTTRKRLGRAQISNEQKIRREIAIMKKCIHPNVVRLIEVIDDPTARKIYLVLEYMEGGEVRWKDVDDKPILPLDDARAIFRDVVLGLEYLHIQGIIHRDIKPANLLLSGDGTVKISDFGVSHFSEKNASENDLDNLSLGEKPEKGLHAQSHSNPFENFFRHSTPASTFSGHHQFSVLAQHSQWGDDLELAKTAGSPAFFAPELCYASEFSPAMSPALSSASQTSFILSPPTPRTVPSTPTGTFSAGSGHTYAPRPPITKAIDIWALGVTLYCFVYGRCPFIAETEFELFNIIPRKQPSFLDSVPGRGYVSPSLKNLLSRLLEKDVSKRITLKEVKEHPWVTEDIRDADRWRIETDPENYQKVHITDDDLKSAVTIMEKIKNRIRRLSISLTNLTRRRSKSISSTSTPVESPSGPRSPIPIMRSPVPTISQSTAHAIAQPPTFTSPVSLPERFQHFHSFNNPGANLTRSDHLERPHSVYSNTSSIEEVDEGEEHSGSGSSAQNSTSYVGRRRIMRPYSHQSQPGGRPLSGGSFHSTLYQRNYSDDQINQSNGLYTGRPVSAGASFSGIPSARVAHSNQSNLSKSWVNSLPSDIESGGSNSKQQQQRPISHHEQRLSHRSSTLSPSSTLVSDCLQEQTEQEYHEKPLEPLAKPSAIEPHIDSQDLAT